MPLEEWRQELSGLREQVGRMNERSTRAEGALMAHEQVCAERYKEILHQMEYLVAGMKVLLVLIGVLFLIELGRASLPQIVEILTKAH